MNVRKIISAIGTIGFFALALVGCEHLSTSGTNDLVTASSNKVVSTHDNSKSFDNSDHEPTSLIWIHVTSPQPSQRVIPGLKLPISGQLARVQREPSIQVTLYQSQSSQYDENGIVLAKANIPVQSNAKFDGSLIVPPFDISKGNYFTLVFRYHWVQGDFTFPLESTSSTPTFQNNNSKQHKTKPIRL